MFILLGQSSLWFTLLFKGNLAVFVAALIVDYS